MYNPSKQTYYNPNIEYIFNNEIIEYDMKNAGINIIQHFKLLPQDQVDKLLNLDKTERHIAVGKLQRNDKGLSSAMSEKFAEMRGLFVSANNLSVDNIISVKKDAIYTVGSCQNLKFGKVEFIPKNRYSSYIRFTDSMNIEIYYNPRGTDIKGIGESGVNKHRLYMLHFLSKIVSYLETKNASLKIFLRSFIDQYKGMELDAGYYIEFNNMSRELNPMYNYQNVLIPLVQISLKEMG